MADPDLPDIEPYYTDAEVALLLDPTGNHIRARSIRSEREARVIYRIVRDVQGGIAR